MHICTMTRCAHSLSSTWCRVQTSQLLLVDVSKDPLIHRPQLRPRCIHWLGLIVLGRMHNANHPRPWSCIWLPIDVSQQHECILGCTYRQTIHATVNQDHISWLLSQVGSIPNHYCVAGETWSRGKRPAVDGKRDIPNTVVGSMLVDKLRLLRAVRGCLFVDAVAGSCCHRKLSGTTRW
jgi:hypothetical protein